MEEKKLRTNPVKVIREYCLDCCLSSSYEVALCPAAHCPLWPFRFGKNPYRANRELSDDRKAELRQRMQRINLERKSQ